MATLYGANISNMTLAQLQAVNGSLSITSQGYAFSGSVNLSGVTNFAAAATAIQKALNANLPVAATTTASSIAPVSVSFTGSLSGFLLNVTSISSGRIQVGAIISGAGITAGAQISSQVSGTRGGVGIYCLGAAGGTTSSEAMIESYGVLTVGSTSSGAVADGELVTGAGVASLTAIESNLSGSGAGSTWLVNIAQTVASENMAMTAAPLSVVYTAITGDTANRGYFSVQQNGNFNFNSSSLTYLGGTAAASLGLAQASGAFNSSPGGIATNVAAWMNNFVQNESDQFFSLQTIWPQLVAATSAQQNAFITWAQSTDGQYNFLANNSAIGVATPPGMSTATTDPGWHIQRRRGHRADCRPCGHLQSGGRGRADNRSRWHLRRPGRECAHPGGGGHLHSGHGGDLVRGGDCRLCRHLQSGGRERADDRSGRHI
jgi:hypothetical protein